MHSLIIVVAALLVIAAASTLESRVRLAAPLLLVLAGIGVSLLPGVPTVEIDPEWVLVGILPPLLYSASVSLPAMDFRREFGAIAGMSVVLVVASSLLLGALFAWAIPDLSLTWGIALGAIVSPTDAVATSIVKKVGASSRVVAVLEGESLLNDATALVLLRSAVAGAAASVSLPGVAGRFVLSVLVAGTIGYVVGRLNLLVRARVSDATVNTVLSFTVPFLASIPAEEVGASGLVAAVVAGLVTGRGAGRVLSPRHRMSDEQTWRAVEVVLEGAVFLVMGLQLSSVLSDVGDDEVGIPAGVGIAALALALTVVVRAAYVTVLLLALSRRARRGEHMKSWIGTVVERLDDPEAPSVMPRRDGRDGGRRLPTSERQITMMRTRLRRGLADIDYFLARPLGWREGTIIVWAGMRGAVTLAAAQTLPDDTPHRPVLVLVAFLVAAASLLVQGASLPQLVSSIGTTAPLDPAVEADERRRLMELLAEVRDGILADRPAIDRSSRLSPEAKDLLLEVLVAQRGALLDARDDGAFSSATLEAVLAVLDADQISLELKGAP